MLKKESAEAIEEILRRRANEIARFHGDYTKNDNHLGSVELALSREIERLRDLAEEIAPKENEQESSAGQD